jgi:hypothetical protein
MKDIIGRELAIGDIVACERAEYRGLILATIIKFTPKMVRVEYKLGKETESMLRGPDDLVKMEGPDLTLHLLKKSG